MARQRLSSIITGALRRVIGDIELQAVISQQRAEIMHQIRDEVNAQAKGFGIDVVDVRVKRADLPEENSQAIFDRMKSERQREAARYRAEGARQAQQIRADADRQRIEIIADCAETGADPARPGRWRRASRSTPTPTARTRHSSASTARSQAYRDALSGQGTTLVLSPDSEFFKYLENGPPLGRPPRRRLPRPQRALISVVRPLPTKCGRRLGRD